MNRFALIGLIPFLAAAPAVAQGVDHSSMPGMAMPAQTTKPATPPKAAAKRTAKPTAKPLAHAHPAAPAPAASQAPKLKAPQTAPMDHSAMPGMEMDAAKAHDHAAMPMPDKAPGAAVPDHGAMPGMQTDAAKGHDPAVMPGMAQGGTSEVEIPRTAPPAAPADHAADRFFDAARMAASRVTLRDEHGGARLSRVMANLLEYQARAGGADGYRWEGEAWYGGDLNRLVLKTEGEAARGEGVEGAEAQVLYSRAIGPYFDVQAGLRQDFDPKGRTYATIGVEGLAPYWFDVQGALFLSNKGEVLARAESTYDLRLTQRLILQPRAELNFAAQDTAATRTGSGLSNAELGLRLRYEFRREFAPYIGVSYDRKFGKTADYARVSGEDRATTSFVVGLRTWF